LSIVFTSRSLELRFKQTPSSTSSESTSAPGKNSDGLVWLHALQLVREHYRLLFEDEQQRLNAQAQAAEKSRADKQEQQVQEQKSSGKSSALSAILSSSSTGGVKTAASSSSKSKSSSSSSSAPHDPNACPLSPLAVASTVALIRMNAMSGSQYSHFPEVLGQIAPSKASKLPGRVHAVALSSTRLPFFWYFVFVDWLYCACM
jgi:hypothetical protein